MATRFVCENNLSNAAGNRLLRMLKHVQSTGDVAIPVDFRRMIQRLSDGYGRNMMLVQRKISLSRLHPEVLKDIPDIEYRYFGFC